MTVHIHGGPLWDRWSALEQGTEPPAGPGRSSSSLLSSSSNRNVPGAEGRVSVARRHRPDGFPSSSPSTTELAHVSREVVCSGLPST